MIKWRLPREPHLPEILCEDLLRKSFVHKYIEWINEHPPQGGEEDVTVTTYRYVGPIEESRKALDASLELIEQERWDELDQQIEGLYLKPTIRGEFTSSVFDDGDVNAFVEHITQHVISYDEMYLFAVRPI
jgi:hypothetical protein